MPSKKQYDLVPNDVYDTKIPLHSEEAFHHGITFQAKFIGMLDVTRPTTRTEIVAAMRRIRYEFKAKGIRKKKVTIDISIDGIKVALKKKKKSKHWPDDGKSTILSHPIYRIFYVSHDSQDLKIFSYIARDGASNVFKCAVFKSRKKAQAMRVVRTVGQAFEVCHKLSITAPENRYEQDEQDTLTQDFLSDRLSDITPSKTKPDFAAENDLDDLSLTLDDGVFKDMIPTTNNRFQQIEREIVSTNNSKNNATTNSAPNSDGLGSGTGSSGYSSFPTSGSPLSAQHEIQLLKEQLDQQTQQTQSAFAQLQLTREQLVSEQTARVEAQTRIHQLLVHNRELLDHIAALVSHLHGGEKVGQLQHSDTTLPQLSSTAKVERWFELLGPHSISRPESGFVSCQDPDQDEDDEKAILESTRNLLSKLSARKQRKLLSLKLGKVTTF